MHLQEYLQLVRSSEDQLASAFMKVARHHRKEPDIYFMCELLSSWSKEHVKRLEMLKEEYQAAKKMREPKRISKALFKEPRKGELALLRDLHDLWLMTKEIEVTWDAVLQAAMSLHDIEFEFEIKSLAKETKRQTDWLTTRIKNAAPQILVVAE